MPDTPTRETQSKTLILQHDDCLAHNPGPLHVENSQRIRAVVAALNGIPRTKHLPAPLASLEQIERVHLASYWQAVVGAEPHEGVVALDPDTFLSPGSILATLRASGAACFAVDQVIDGKATNAFCATRPPGHHAEAGLAMGFCLLNHVAIAARHALAREGIERVAIADFDVHHGNGTQAIFAASPEVLYLSSHQMPLYPGTGSADETGCGNILNMPLAPNTGGREFRAAWSQSGLARLRAFSPDLILVSAGFDAHERDPLGQLNLHDEDYDWITRELCDIAANCCNSRVVSVLEGGYDLEALASASRTHVKVLAGG